MMTIKKFSIFTSIIAGIIIVLLVTLSCIKVNGNITGAPDRAIAYLKSSTGVTCDETRNAKHFEKIKKLYSQMTNVSVFDYLASGEAVDTFSTQDLDDNKNYPSSTEKQENYCLELIFKDKQTVIIKIDGDTKVIEFYSILFVVKKSALSEVVEVYYSSTEDFESSKSYYNCKKPLYLRANGNKLVKYLSYMEETQAD